MSRSSRLNEFSPHALPHTGLFGVFLGVHAVGDVLNVLHTGVGCKGKTQRQIVHHDLGLEAHAKVGWTELDETELIKDSETPLLNSLGELYRRRKPAAILVTASAAVEFSGLDLARLEEKASQEVPCPIRVIPRAAFEEDLWAGYAGVIRGILEMVPWEKSASDEPLLSLVGYFFHRHEMEQAANLAELKRMLKGVGIRSGQVFLSGENLAVLKEAHRSSILACLPYSPVRADELATITRRKAVACPLPLGIAATGAWLGALAEAAAIDRYRVENFTAREEARIEQRLRKARGRLAGKQLAIMADTPAAAGLSLLARELGMDPVLIVLLDRSLGGRQEFERIVSEVADSPPRGTGIIVAPSLRELRQIEGLDASGRPFDMVIRPDLALSGTGWERVATLEYGFPSNHKHYIYPRPELGYAGTLALAERLMDATQAIY